MCLPGTSPDRLCSTFENCLRNACTQLGLDPDAATKTLRTEKGGAAVNVQLLVDVLCARDAAACCALGSVQGTTLQLWVDAPAGADHAVELLHISNSHPYK